MGQFNFSTQFFLGGSSFLRNGYWGLNPKFCCSDGCPCAVVFPLNWGTLSPKTMLCCIYLPTCLSNARLWTWRILATSRPVNHPMPANTKPALTCRTDKWLCGNSMKWVSWYLGHVLCSFVMAVHQDTQSWIKLYQSLFPYFSTEWTLPTWT